MPHDCKQDDFSSGPLKSKDILNMPALCPSTNLEMIQKYSIDEIKVKLAPLFKEPGLQMVLLFGSLISGPTHRESDIDLGFLFDGPVDLLDLTSRVVNLLHTDRVDVIDLRRASPLLSFSAAREGKLLYERTPGQFNAFFSLSFRRYVDTKKLRDAQQRAIQHFLKGKGLL